ncbi:MAG: Hsp20/alpha crystallin family protein [Parcubacteria group bacterium]|nr:Hsp20/alpha crystallin family protein [Parcubacteria group bacterium]NQU82650.1 Hsp20/alpha crystallin family protein [Parcubacteria group bacterium]
MAIFKKLKKDIGIDEEEEMEDEEEEEEEVEEEEEEEEEEEKKEKKIKKRKEKKGAKKKKKKEPKSTPVDIAKEITKEIEDTAPEIKVLNEEEDEEESITKAPMSSKHKDDTNWLKSKGQLAVDVYQTNENFCVQAPIAGVDQSNLDIAIENDLLVIKGERSEPNQDKDKKYLYQECYWGPFSREVMLPEDVLSDKIKASLKNGILLITIPKSKGIKKKVTIDVG